MYSQEAADRAVFFIEHLKHTKGEWAGKEFKLMDWQREKIIEPLFGTLNEDGTRQYRTAYIEIPRKNGKSEIAAAIALYLLLADGEIGGEIYSAAADRDNASLVFKVAADMVQQSPALIKRCHKPLTAQKRLINYDTNSFYHAISSEAYSKFGYDAHGIIFDELHTQPNRELWDVLTTSTGARSQPLIVAITTAGYDRNSICYELHDYADKVLRGIVDDPTFLSVIYAAPEEADWTDEKVWFACNPALGVFRKLDEMQMLCKRAQETPALEMAFRRLYLNQWTSSIERWMQIDKWDACKDEQPELEGKDCYGGLDLSATTDLTSLGLAFPIDEKDVWILPFFWIPEDTMREKERKDRVPYALWNKQGYVKATPGNVIDYDFIKEDIRELAHVFRIKEIAYDEWNATDFVLDLKDEGFVMVPMRQGAISMSPPTKELMVMVLSKRLHHNGHPVLRWNIDNLVVRTNATGDIKPDKEKATQKIDGAVAMIMAIDRLVRNRDFVSVYETRGFD